MNVLSGEPTECVICRIGNHCATNALQTDDALVGADILFLVTEWKQFRDLDASLLIAKMNNPVIIDGRNLWHDHDFTSTSVKYVGIGRNSIEIRNDVSVDMSNDIEQLNRLVS